MASLNKVMLIGKLGKDPELRYTASGTPVASFSIATSEKIKNKAGDYEEKTEWHNIVLWSRLAELSGQYLSKGKMVYIEGRLQTRKWQDKDGKDRYTTEIVGDKVEFLSPKSEGNGGDQRSPAANRSQEHNQGKAYEEPPYDADEIPF